MGKGQGGLKMNKESQLIKKSSVSKAAQQRQPVIIYTHSPKVIQTHPRNFMELVQKLTGLYRSEPVDEEAFKPLTPPRKEELEITTCNCVVAPPTPTPLIPDYANNFAVFESDFLCSNSNKPLLNFADPSFLFP